jgi:hypothetical protein
LQTEGLRPFEPRRKSAVSRQTLGILSIML